MLEIPPLLRDLKLDDLATLVSLVEHGSFSFVARSHGVTPSTVRKSLGRIETQLGCRLFSRTTREIVALPLATAIASVIREGLEQLGAIEKLISENGLRETLRFAVDGIHSVLALALQQQMPNQVLPATEIGPEGFALPPSAAPFELALVPVELRVAAGWVRIPVTDVAWSLFEADGAASDRPLVALDAPSPLQPLDRARQLPSFQHAMHLAAHTRAPIWAPHWAKDFYGLGGWVAHAHEQVQPLVLLCHPTRVSSAVARRVSGVWEAALNKRGFDAPTLHERAG